MDQPEIKLCLPGDAAFEEFMSFPASLYEAGSVRLRYGESIDTANLHSCILLYRNNSLQGRLALYDNKQLFYAGGRAMAVGNYECTDDNFCSQALLLYAKSMAESLGAKWLIGPMNGSTWHSHRFCTDRPESYFFTEYQHKDYYPDQFIKAGFREIARYYSQLDQQLIYMQPGLEKWQKINQERGFRIRPVNIDDFDKELEKIHAFCSEVFSGNFLYTPISLKDFKDLYKQIKPWLDPRFLMLAENNKKELIALFFSIPDLYDETRTTLIVKTIARKRDRQYAGLIREMASATVKLALENGYKRTIHAFMHEDNVSRSVSGRYSGDLYKTYILLAMKL